MAIDILQEKIRKMKNPSVLELAMPLCDLPPQFAQNAEGYAAFCIELLNGLKDSVPAVRVGFSAFALLGAEGIAQLQKILRIAAELDYYVVLDAPEIVSPMMAKVTAEALLSEKSEFVCDALLISGYAGSDIIKLFCLIAKN